MLQHIPTESLQDINCTGVQMIDGVYDAICHCLKIASVRSVPVMKSTVTALSSGAMIIYRL